MFRLDQVWSLIHKQFSKIEYFALDGNYDEGFVDFGHSDQKPYRFYFNNRLDSYILFVYDVFDQSESILEFYGLEHIVKFLSH